ncbi:ACP S-malonyltransferase [Tumebacillus permanentifrigoris]|uniref:[acyl-carrier-protein] S-malonyltransferase n=1 Tax=Tumebacillus permanentifrigoris TaxID=378543 RepID=A0A316D4T1_9BACL|nr:ACP S-malonyltransferase [Tumebacillus permanentifrigoris]PWK07929.1 [acyl-carrier-protein] S-malonyltransferase [Tumebacillus permanentifrigoris]
MEKIALLFPGQGSQYPGMTQWFYDQFPMARRTMEEASDVLGLDLARICQHGSPEELSKPETLQPAVLTASVVAFRVFQQEIGVLPEFCAGHSLGEYAALTCSGAISFADALRIVQRRGRLAAEVVEQGGTTMSILKKVSIPQVEAECRRLTQAGRMVGVSCYNADSQVAVSGQEAAVRELERWVESNGGSVVRLPDSPPYHSPLMQEAADRLREELSAHTYYPLRWPVISNVTGAPYPGAESIVDLLTAQIAKPVQWQKTMHYLHRQGITKAIEIGPKNVLTTLVSRNVEDMQAYCFDQRTDRQKLVEFFTGRIEQQHVPHFLGRCLTIAVSTPNLNPDARDYERCVIAPYRRIEAIQHTIEQSDQPATLDQMKEALQLLQTIFTYKQTPLQEQKEWLHLLREETGTYYEFPELG